MLWLLASFVISHIDLRMSHYLDNKDILFVLWFDPMLAH